MTSPWFRRRIRRLFQAAWSRPCLEVLEDRTLLSFGAPILSSTDVGPSGIAAGDLNGDGKLDVVTANTINNSVSVLFGRGDGTFQAPVNYAVGSKPVRVGVGSLRGNGLLDLVAVNNGDKSLTLLLNNGNGTFRNTGTVSTDPGPTSVVFADWNGDGKLDLAVGATDGSQTFNVDILPGNGNGTFGPLTRVSSHDWGSGGPADLITGDFNRDGKLDLVAANYGYSVAYFQCNGDGTFQTGVGTSTDHRNFGVITADLQGDGILDLISAGDTYGWVSTLRGNGNGTFQTAQRVGGGSSFSAGAADFRGTGKTDLVVVDQPGDTLTWLQNAGDGSFPTTQTYPLASGPGAKGNGLVVGDFNGDGKPDVAVALTQFNWVSVLLDQPDATQLAVSAADTSVAGTTLSVTVTATMPNGSTSTSYTGRVHFTATDGNAVLPLDYTFTTADQGTHTFSVTFKTAGPQSLIVTDAALGFTAAKAVTVTPAAADHLVFGQQPSNTVAGQALSPAVTVRVLDLFGNLVTSNTSNVTVALSTNPGASTLSGTTTVAVSNGIATFTNLSLDKAAAGYTLQATDGSLIAANSNSFSINPASAHHLAFGVVPSGTAIGKTISPAIQVQVVDQFGNLVITDSSTVTVALGANPAGGTLSGTTTVAAVNGIATFSNLSIDKAAAGYTLQATDGSLGAAVSTTFDITSLPHHLAFGVGPSTITAGQAINPAVAVVVLDQFGSPVTNDSSTVTVALAANPPGGTLSGTLTATVVNGVATFSNLSLDKAGSGYTLQATDGSYGGVVSSAFSIIPAAADHLVFGGVSGNLIVNGDFEAGRTGFTSGLIYSPGNLLDVGKYDVVKNPFLDSQYATSYGDHTSGSGFMLAANGATDANTVVWQQTVSVVPNSTYQFSIWASSWYSLNPARLDFLFNDSSIGTFSPPVTAGSWSRFTATWNSGSSTTLTLKIIDRNADFSGNDYAVDDISLIGPGSGPSIGTVMAGQPIGPTVQVRVLDRFNNLVTTDNSNVTVALGSNPAGGTLSGTLTVAAVNGIATFSNLSLDKAAIGYTLQATDSTLSAATSNSFSITPAAAHHLAFGVAPSNATAGVAMNPAVTVRVVDQFGNLVTTDTSLVTVALASNPAGGTLSGTLTMAAVNGVATFNNLSLDKAAAGYTLQASDGSLGKATSGTFSITAAAHHLVFDVGPSNVIVGQPFSPALQVRVLDPFGNLVTTDSSNVTLALVANPAGGTLSGTVTTAAVNGIATFANLSLNKLGTGYTLQASDGTLGAAVSSSFNVVAGPAAQLLVMTQPPASILTGVGFGLVVTLEDVLGNLATAYNGAVTVALANNPGGATLHGTVTVAVVNGVATFASLSLDKAGSGYTLRVTAGNLTATTGAMVVQTPNQAYISALYLDVLQRPVDAVGLTYWSTQLDQGAPRSIVAQQITHSAEYFAIVIRAAYRKFLGRAADDAGLAYWINRMQNGLTDQQLEAGFIGSAEYYTHSGGTNQLWIEAMYHDLLGRSPDAAGESYWLQQLAAGADRATVAYGFAASTEREGQLVQQDYLTYLHRTASSSEVAYWVNAFTQGLTNEDIITGFVSSEEYYRAHTGG